MKSQKNPWVADPFILLLRNPCFFDVCEVVFCLSSSINVR